MAIVDANIILRYLLADDKKLHGRAKKIVETEEIYLPFEVLAEAVYVLEKVYKVKRKDTTETLLELLKYPNIETVDITAAEAALQCYRDTGLDFVDTLLYGYSKSKGAQIHSFDKKLVAILEAQ